MKRIIYLVTIDWFFAMHRLPLARAAKAAGYEVYVATRIDQDGERIREAGMKVIPMQWERRSRGVVDSIRAVREIRRVYCDYQPDLVHQISVKSVLLGSLAALSMPPRRRPVIVNNFTGLGTLFVSDAQSHQWLRSIVRGLSRKLFRTLSACQLFENPDDRREFYGRSETNRDSVRTILGVGVNTNEYSFRGQFPKTPVVLLASRLIRPKGVAELVEAHRLLISQGQKLKVVIVGKPDMHSSSAIPQEMLDAWVEDGLVEYWGFRHDMAECYALATIVCLPSWYREGVPRSLLEAASCGRPCITTDMPGCREIILHDETGLLVPPRDPEALARAIELLVADPEKCRQMGTKARKRVEELFSEEKVIGESLALYASLLGRDS